MATVLGIVLGFLMLIVNSASAIMQFLQLRQR